MDGRVEDGFVAEMVLRWFVIGDVRIRGSLIGGDRGGSME